MIQLTAAIVLLTAYFFRQCPTRVTSAISGILYIAVTIKVLKQNAADDVEKGKSRRGSEHKDALSRDMHAIVMSLITATNTTTAPMHRSELVV